MIKGALYSVYVSRARICHATRWPTKKSHPEHTSLKHCESLDSLLSDTGLWSNTSLIRTLTELPWPMQTFSG